MKYVYRTQGTCSTNIELDVEEGVLKEVAYWGGCNGSLQGISRLVTGMKVEDVNRLLKQFETTQKLMRQMRGKKGKRRPMMPPGMGGMGGMGGF